MSSLAAWLLGDLSGVAETAAAEASAAEASAAGVLLRRERLLLCRARLACCASVM